MYAFLYIIVFKLIIKLNLHILVGNKFKVHYCNHNSSVISATSYHSYYCLLLLLNPLYRAQRTIIMTVANTCKNCIIILLCRYVRVCVCVYMCNVYVRAVIEMIACPYIVYCWSFFFTYTSWSLNVFISIDTNDTKSMRKNMGNLNLGDLVICLVINLWRGSYHVTPFKSSRTYGQKG